MHTTTLPARRSFAGVPQVTFHPDERPARPPRAGSGRLVLLCCMALALLASAGGLAIRSAAADGPEAEPPAAPRPASAWTDVNRPIHLFELAGSEFGRLPLGYRARRRENTGERQDFLTYGQFGTRMPFLSLSVLRRGTAAPDRGDLVVGLARLAGDAHLAVTDTALPTLLPTRFGAFAVTDITLADAAASLSCLGFRLEAAGPSSPVEIAGLACRPGARGMDRAALACVLDRVDLLSAGDDDALQSFFVDAERRRGSSCRPTPLLAAGARPIWLDSDAPSPGLRHLVGSRMQ